MFPKYTITLANYYEENDNWSGVGFPPIVRSTITVVQMPEDTIIDVKEFWYSDKFKPSSEITKFDFNVLTKTVYEIAKIRNRSKVVILNEPLVLIKRDDDYVSTITGVKDLMQIGFGTIENSSPKIGRNDLCVCGSGKKFKKCCFGLPDIEQKIQYIT